MSKHPRPSPIYLMAGGRGRSRVKGDPLLSRIITSSPVAQPKIAYIGAASNDDRSFFSMIEYSMLACGAGRVTLASLVSPHIKIEGARETLKSADMVFVSGGDVEAGMAILEDRGVMPLLRELHQAGKPFFGISAGSIMLGRQWVRWKDPDDDSTASPFPCMGFAPLVCDTHSEGEGWGELATLLRLSPAGTTGYGLPSGSGLCVYPDGRTEAMEGPVHCFARKGAKVVQLDDLIPPSP